MNKTRPATGKEALMKRFLALAFGIVVIVGAVAAWAPFPAIANVKDPSRCGGLGACRIEEGDPPVCPPCYYFEYCLPKCGCRPIPGCELVIPSPVVAPVTKSGPR
jgi:hypothetical protein